MKTNPHIDRRKDLAIRAAKEAGKVLVDNFGRVIKTKAKSDRDLVTDIDLRAEEKIVKLIKKDYPDDDILSEESRYPFLDSEFKWIIDPLDGTHNYIHNIGIFGTSIALEFKGEVVIGVIYMPLTDELYVGGKGKGAYLNGRRINVSKRGIEQATVVYDSSIRYNKKPMLSGLGELVDRVFNVRMFGSTCRSLSYVASGQVEAEIEFNDKVWDFAAGLLLVEEAGGESTDFQGRRWTTDTKRYIASNGVVHKEILKIIGE